MSTISQPPISTLMDATNPVVLLLKDQERLCEDFLGKLFKKSLEGLHMAVNEIHRCQGYSWYYTSFHDINNLKSNLIYVQEQYDAHLRKITDEIKEHNKYTREIVLSVSNEHDQLCNEVEQLFEKTSDQLLLMSVFSAIGLFASIETMSALFTGTGVLGIAPLRMGFVITNTASEMMFKDKLTELEAKLTYVIRNIEMKKPQQVDHLNLYFNLFRKKLSH